MAVSHHPASRSSPTGSRRVAINGFTLIELMITVVIISILAGLALPSYRQFVLRGHRADAQAFLSEVVARQQHFLLDRRSYAISITDAASANGLAMTVPTTISTWYVLTVETDNSAPPTFVAKATPTTAQAADTCGTLIIDQKGTKSVSGTGSCW